MSDVNPHEPFAALYVPEDAPYQRIVKPAGADWLRWAQGLVDPQGHGLIEAISLQDDSLTLWVDEEYFYKGRSLNVPATLLAQLLGYPAPPGWRIMGPAFITGGVDEEGWTLPLADEMAYGCSALLDRIHQRWAVWAEEMGQQ